jgi:hypothetical protein
MFPPGWLDQSFGSSWIINENNGSTSLSVVNSSLYLCANYRLQPFVSGISAMRSVGNMSTTSDPYLVIMHKETSSNSSLAFSIGVEDQNNVWHYSAWDHTRSYWNVTSYDSRALMNGTIKSVSIRFSDEFNQTYAGGNQCAIVSSVGFYPSPFVWYISTSRLVSSPKVSTLSNEIIVSDEGNLSNGIIVTARRSYDLNFNESVGNFLNVTVKTSSVYVAARVTIWTSNTSAYTVLLKTYNDFNWHTEIISLSAFKIIGPNITLVELGLLELNNQPSAMVWYANMSFNSLQVG